MPVLLDHWEPTFTPCYFKNSPIVSLVLICAFPQPHTVPVQLQFPYNPGALGSSTLAAEGLVVVVARALISCGQFMTVQGFRLGMLWLNSIFLILRLEQKTCGFNSRCANAIITLGQCDPETIDQCLVVFEDRTIC